jgi:hypothetical protein
MEPTVQNEVIDVRGSLKKKGPNTDKVISNELVKNCRFVLCRDITNFVKVVFQIYAK